MGEADKVSEADRTEQAGLERAVADAERMLLTLPPGMRPFFNGFLHNAKARLGFLEKKIHDAELEQKEQTRNEAALASLAQKEDGLNFREKETYNGFLKEDFFTKHDFARLANFYAHSWDRLSENGKDQMSHRVWEGIRRDEYTFGELPPEVRAKETKRAYTALSKQADQFQDVSTIPEKDRSDFVRAYEAGNERDAEKTLDRDCFKQSMFRREKPNLAAATVQAKIEGAMIERMTKDGGVDSSTAKRSQDDLTSLNMDGVEAAAGAVFPTALANLGAGPRER